MLRMLGKGRRSSRGVTRLAVSVAVHRAEGLLLLLQTALRANEAPPVNILTLGVPQRTYGSMGPVKRGKRRREKKEVIEKGRQDRRG